MLRIWRALWDYSRAIVEVVEARGAAEWRVRGGAELLCGNGLAEWALECRGGGGSAWYVRRDGCGAK